MISAAISSWLKIQGAGPSLALIDSVTFSQNKKRDSDTVQALAPVSVSHLDFEIFASQILLSFNHSRNLHCRAYILQYLTMSGWWPSIQNSVESFENVSYFVKLHLLSS